MRSPSSSSLGSSTGSARRSPKRKVTPSILEECLFGSTDLTAEERSRFAFSDSYAALVAGDESMRSLATRARNENSSKGGGDALIDDMLEPDNHNKQQAETITYQRPDGVKLDVATPLDAPTTSSDTIRGSIRLSDLNSVQHDGINNESKLLEDSNAELTQSLMDLGLGGGTVAAPSRSNQTSSKSDNEERKRENTAKLDAWIEGEDEDDDNEDDDDDDDNQITYTKPDGQTVDLAVPLKMYDGSARNSTHHTARSSKSNREMNDMSTSMRGRLQQAAEADDDDDDNGYGGYGGPSPYDSSGHSGNWSTDHSKASLNSDVDGDDVGIASGTNAAPAKDEESKCPTPPPADDPDGTAAAPSRPAKNRAEAPVLLDDKHIYDVNEIRSLSTAGKKEDHARKVRSAKVGDALADLEGSVGGFGLEDRWSKREMAGGGAETGVVRESLTLEGLASLDAPQHDRNNESSLAASGSVSSLGISSPSLNQPSSNDPGGASPTALPSLPENMAQNDGFAHSSARPTHAINLQELRRLSSQGIPEEGSHRALAWRVLMGYLPPDTSKWEAVLKRDRGLYRNLVSELFVRPLHHEEEADHLKQEGRRLRGSGVQKEGQSVRDHGGVNRASDNEGHNSIDMRNDGANEGLIKSTSTIDSQDIAEVSKAAESFPASDGELNAASIADAAAKTRQCRRSSDIAREMMTKRNSMEDTEDNDEENGATSGDQTNNVGTPQSKSSDSAMPVHTPQMLVPARVREQWKQSGRDSELLEAFSDNTGHMNALLVIDDEGNTYDENGDKSPRKDGGRVHVNDDPLSLESGSKWAQFFENANLLDEIRKDVVRTHPDLTFFLEPEERLGQRRYAAVERVLFVWAKLNKGVRYVQGMNEIVATLYFVLANDSNEEWACEAEADTYFLFNTLMVEMRDIFVPDLDHADTGIQGRISSMIALLSLHDPEVRCHLDDCGIDGSFYSIRWLTTLLSREFILPDTIRLWDSMFASTHKDNFMRYVCVTMVILMREELLRSDFGTCLRLLQAFPPTDVDRLLEASRALWIYESQITLACHKGGISLNQALQTIAPPPSIIFAYGLPGGVALSREERMKQAGKDSIAAAKEKAADAKDSAKSFFGSAKQAWGQWKDGLQTEGRQSPHDKYRRSKTTDF